MLGANGTGKSSIVCALCLGLGGSPKDIKRAPTLKEFVKTGAEEGFSEICLTGKKEDGTVRVCMRCVVLSSHE